MLTKKVCMVGSFSVGKTALIQRFVHSIFSDDYLSTVGVKISKKDVTTSNGVTKLVLWDLEGRDDYGDINMSYLRGSMGIILVADGTREETLSAALSLKKMAFDMIGPIPYILLINKQDLQSKWEVTSDLLSALQDNGFTVMLTSAKTGLNVEEAFINLTEQMLG